MTTIGAVGANVEAPQRKTGGAGKALASAVMPGLGQFLDGRNGAGAGYMGASLATIFGQLALQESILKDVFKASEAATDVAIFNVSKCLKSLPKGKVHGLIALALAGPALWIASIVDAYKGGNKNA